MRARPPPGRGADRRKEAPKRQEALRELTEQLQGGLPGEAGEAAREALREAERNMGEAGDDLREGGDTSGALDRQSDAIDGLREGMREMAQDMRAAEDRRARPAPGLRERRDLSSSKGATIRSAARSGPRARRHQRADAAPTPTPPPGRAALLDEIPPPLGRPRARPEIELDYLRRLLDRF